MRAEFNIQPEAFVFEAQPGEFETGQAEAPRNRGGPAYVRWVQQSLNKILGLRLAVDGRMGPKTRSAIRSFQQKHGLVANGVVGPPTVAALVKAGAGAPAGPVLATPTQTTKAPRPASNPYKNPPGPIIEKNPYTKPPKPPLSSSWKQQPSRCTNQQFKLRSDRCNDWWSACLASCGPADFDADDPNCKERCNAGGNECFDRLERSCGIK
jgi:Putative peptidoglycan binding domain